MPVELSELAIRPRRSGAVDDGNLVNATGAFSSLEPEKTVSMPRDFALDSDISTIIASTNTWGLLISSCVTISLSDLITNKREIQSTVLADDKEIIVLGGLINEEVEESVNRVPILGDIPLLGRLFRSSAESVEKRNLMVFLRPTILRDSITTKDLSEERFNFIRAKQILETELYDESK
jgi:type II secretory pathway component GspD/PulD (secretin)